MLIITGFFRDTSISLKSFSVTVVPATKVPHAHHGANSVVVGNSVVEEIRLVELEARSVPKAVEVVSVGTVQQCGGFKSQHETCTDGFASRISWHEGSAAGGCINLVTFATRSATVWRRA